MPASKPTIYKLNMCFCSDFWKRSWIILNFFYKLNILFFYFYYKISFEKIERISHKSYFLERLEFSNH